ncbi:hypothetical protein [Primorskyibacter marinus]|uniref:hypothetical protein n=1 Tax=Primorskyibacter marinus TaxID=1977320 RepID=UPI000E304645|nr:hypothetical protein [Primorskyibacter marinus]
MSNSDSFIDEVTEEVRRDRLFALMKRYGWIAVLVVILLVGGAAWNEWRKASARASAEQLGDAILAALEQDDAQERVSALTAIDAPTPGGKALLHLLTSSEQASAGDDAGARNSLDAISADAEVPEIYRQIAAYKALTRGGTDITVEDRRLRFEGLATPGSPVRLLAEEQLALIDIETGDRDAALTRLQALLEDAEITSGLRRRATQLIVALGGTPGEVSAG